MLGPEEFLDLMEKVEADGGVHLPDRCLPRKYRLKADGKWRDFFTTGCRADSRFFIPYDGEEYGSRGVIACANDDLVHLWPRFNGSAGDGVPA